MIPSFCLPCCLSKIHKFPFSRSETVYTAPLQLIHSDLWGPAPIPSSGGYRYYVHFVDAYSKFTWLYLLKNKSNVIQTFINFKTQVELQLDSKIKAFQSDWGGEFRSFQSFLTQHGIIHGASYPHTQEQNGVIEKKHRHIIKNGLALLAKSSIPLKY